jgi:protein-S-isoprenylcysteine O-methyltransferase Ste14
VAHVGRQALLLFPWEVYLTRKGDGMDTTKHRIWPPAWFLAAVVLMIGLDRALPGMRLVESPLNRSGWVLIALGLMLGVWASLHFRMARTSPKPFRQPNALVIGGPYRFTRNPMYLGLAIALAGVAVALGSLTPWLVIPLFIWVITARVIRAEEAIMRARFGEEYQRYTERVRRWI